MCSESIVFIILEPCCEEIRKDMSEFSDIKSTTVREVNQNVHMQFQ
jgi:hypothetical protein